MKRVFCVLFVVMFLGGLIVWSPLRTQGKVNEVSARNEYTGNGSTSAFTFGFRILTKNDFEVLVDGTVKVVDTDYTVSGVGDSGGGTVNFTTAPASATAITLLRKQPLEQASDYINKQTFASRAEIIEKDLDKVIMTEQMHTDTLNRSIRARKQENLDMTLPTVSARQSNVLGFDSAGKPVALSQLDQSAQTVTATNSTTARSLAERFSEVVNVRDFGAVCDRTTDDTAAFQAALDFVEALTILRPLGVPPGDCVISNLTFDALDNAGTGEEGGTWGIIGSGIGSTTLTGLTGSTGVMLQFGKTTGGNALGRRRLILQGFKVVGHSGYDEGIQIGTTNTNRIPVGIIRRVEVKGFTKTDAAGVFLRNAISFVIDSLYSYLNHHGIKLGTTAGVGIVNAVSIHHSQFRVNTIGMAIYTANTLRTSNNVYESNSQDGVLAKFTASAGTWNNWTSLANWYEANTVSGLHIAASAAGLQAPVSIVSISDHFTGGSSGPIFIDDAGQNIRFIDPFWSGSVNLAVNNRGSIIFENAFCGIGVTCLYTGFGASTVVKIQYGRLTTTPVDIVQQEGYYRASKGFRVPNNIAYAAEKADSRAIDLLKMTTEDLPHLPGISLSMAVDDVVTLAPLASSGFLFVVNQTSNRTAQFTFDGGSGTNKLHGSAAEFSVTKDNSGSVNVYLDAGNFKIQNKQAGTRTIHLQYVGFR